MPANGEVLDFLTFTMHLGRGVEIAALSRTIFSGTRFNSTVGKNDSHTVVCYEFQDGKLLIELLIVKLLNKPKRLNSEIQKVTTDILARSHLSISR